MKQLEGKCSAVILLCGCRSSSGCHRAAIARKLQEEGYTTSNLAWTVKPQEQLSLAL
jgi:hypothetical protein